MSMIFVSFLGTGNQNTPGYSRVAYTIGDDRIQTEFAQRAILQHHGAASFDRVHLLMTSESKRKHRDLLHEELLSIGVRPEAITEDASTTTNMDAEEQWRWFESLLRVMGTSTTSPIRVKSCVIVRRKQAECSGADRQLLRMVQDKFGELASQAPPSGLYDESYFRTQLILAEMLLKRTEPLLLDQTNDMLVDHNRL